MTAERPGGLVMPKSAPSALKDYAAHAFSQIDGWTSVGALAIAAHINDIQRDWRVEGGAMEIGVYHGKFFIALNSLIEEPTTKSIAVDLFGLQSLNIDGSGRGDEQIFRANLSKFDRHRGSNVVIHSADSTRTTPSEILERVLQRPRIVSIDGGHTAEHTIHDIELAAAVLDDRGVILVDEILNRHWLGVIEGTIGYLNRRPTMWPFVIGENKLGLVPMSHHERYLKELRRRLPNPSPAHLCGYDLLAT
jgi:hypothetical protein